MVFNINLKALDIEKLLLEKKRLETIMHNIFQLKLNPNGKDIQKKCDKEQVAHALYFIIVIKYLGLLNPKLTKTNYFDVAVKIVINNENLFEQALEMVHSQLIAIDPKENFLERLSLLFSKDNRNNLVNRIQLFKNTKAAATTCVQLTSSNTSNLDYPTNSDSDSSEGNLSNVEDNISTSYVSDDQFPVNTANNALSKNNMFAGSDLFILKEKIDEREKPATLAVIENTFNESPDKLIHFLKAKEFLEHAKIYIANNPNSLGIKDVYSRLATFTVFEKFVKGLNNNQHFLNSYLSCEYLSIFIEKIKIENGTLPRTVLSGYPQYPSVDMSSANESASRNRALGFNSLTK